MKKLREEQEARGCSFYQMIDNFKNTLKHEDYTLTEDIITDIEWMENYIFTLGKSFSDQLSDNQLLEFMIFSDMQHIICWTIRLTSFSSYSLNIPIA